MSDDFRGLLNQQRPDFPTKNPQVILITGATSGIGKATARLLVSLGHSVAALGRRSERLTELEAECTELMGNLLPLTADVTDEQTMQHAVRETMAHFDRIDVLVANAGLGHRGAIVESDWHDLETVLDTNIKGVLHSIRACVPALRATGNGGHIIITSSILGAVPAPYSAVYGASKAAVDSLAQALRMELKPDNIHVTTMQIGQTHTEFSEKRRGKSGRVASKIPTMTPEKVALHIARTMERRKRTVILRWFDRLVVVGGRFFPHIADRILARIYG